MMKLSTLSFLVSLTLTGCASVSSDVKTESTPTLVISAPNPPPPETPTEVKPAAPGIGYQWVAGYWDFIGGHHVWRAGRWLENKSGYTYVKAHWENGPSGWQLHVPHWQRRHEADSRLARQ
jgi:hypothetical protein